MEPTLQPPSRAPFTLTLQMICLTRLQMYMKEDEKDLQKSPESLDTLLLFQTGPAEKK